jgi:hypothetical protein
MQPGSNNGSLPAGLLGVALGAGIAFLIHSELVRRAWEKAWAEYDPVEEAQHWARRALGIE